MLANQLSLVGYVLLICSMKFLSFCHVLYLYISTLCSAKETQLWIFKRKDMIIFHTLVLISSIYFEAWLKIPVCLIDDCLVNL